MRRLRSWLAVGLLLIPLTTLTRAADAKVRKVLPNLVDLEGRASLHPSLYERDAYQAYLRKNPDLVGGMRFDVLWSAPVAKAQPLELRLELRGATLRTNNAPAGVTQTNAVTLTNAVTPARFGARWTRVTLSPETLRQVGDVTAWKATLLRGGSELASTQSFLW